MRNRLIDPKCLATMCPCVMYIALPNSTLPEDNCPQIPRHATLEATPGHQLPNKSLWRPTRLGKPQIKSMSLRRSCDRKRQVVRMTRDIEIFISYIYIYMYMYMYIYIYIHNHTYIILYLLHHTIYLRYMSLCIYIYIIIYIPVISEIMNPNESNSIG